MPWPSSETVSQDSYLHPLRKASSLQSQHHSSKDTAFRKNASRGGDLQRQANFLLWYFDQSGKNKHPSKLASKVAQYAVKLDLPNRVDGDVKQSCRRFLGSKNCPLTRKRHAWETVGASGLHLQVPRRLDPSIRQKHLGVHPLPLGPMKTECKIMSVSRL